MKAISLWQPYASLIMAGYKQYETRSWEHGYRGEIALHAAKRWEKSQVEECQELMESFTEMKSFFDKPLPLGAIVGIVHIEDILATASINYRGFSDLEYAIGDYTEGRYAWKVRVVSRPENPIPARGEQGFWVWNKQPVGEVEWVTVDPPKPNIVQRRLF